jgi:hypothetical protein
MADAEITATQTHAAPLNYQIPGAQEILLKVASANFDGSGAGSAWQPAIQLIGPSGQVLRTFLLSSQLAAGASADVTFFPLGGVGGDGIKYDVDNVGDWLSVVATGTGGPSPASIEFDAQNTNGDVTFSKSGGTGTLGILSSQNGDLDVEHSGLTGALNIEQSGGGGMNIFQSGAGGFNFSNSSGPFDFNHSGSGDMEFDIGALSGNVVFTNGALGPVFQINQDGSLHGLTGQTLTFDL